MHPAAVHAAAQVNVFFSAHGVPKSYVEEAGDPYKEEMEECVALIMAELQRRGRANDHTLAYQSRVGPVEWLQPYTDDSIRCAAAGLGRMAAALQMQQRAPPNALVAESNSSSRMCMAAAVHVGQQGRRGLCVCSYASILLCIVCWATVRIIW